jgi:hypothetical protein
MNSHEQVGPGAESMAPLLAGVKATPSGWPAASLDPGCGRCRQHRSGPSEGRSTEQDPPNQGLYRIRGLPAVLTAMCWRGRAVAERIVVVDAARATL